MYFFLENGIIIGSGEEPHSFYQNVKVSSLDMAGIDNPMGYKLEKGRLVKSEELIEGEARKARDEAKAKRDEKISTLTVDIGGKVFDADEKSQQRMLMAIQTMGDAKPIMWKLADNSIALASKTELEEALRLAAKKMSELIVGADNGD